jgi:hypothetical protein
LLHEICQNGTDSKGLGGAKTSGFGTKRTNSIAAVSANDPKRTFQRRWRCHSMGEHAPLTLVAITFLDARSSIESVRRDAESPLPAHRVCRALALGLLPVGVSRSGRWVSQLRKHRGHAGRGNRLASSIPALRLSCAVCLLPSRVRLLCASARVCLLSTRV